MLLIRKIREISPLTKKAANQGQQDEASYEGEQLDPPNPHNPTKLSHSFTTIDGEFDWTR